MDNGSSQSNQRAEGHHMALASDGSTAIVADQVTVIVHSENVRDKELAYLDRLLKHHNRSEEK